MTDQKPIPTVAKSATVEQLTKHRRWCNSVIYWHENADCNCPTGKVEPVPPVAKSATTEPPVEKHSIYCDTRNSHGPNPECTCGVVADAREPVNVDEYCAQIEKDRDTLKLRAEKAEDGYKFYLKAWEQVEKDLATTKNKLQTAERERDDYKASVGDLAKTCSELIKERDALRAELENIKKDRCEECGTKLYFGPPCCPRCGAPNCCPLCCMVAATESLRAENARLRHLLRRAKCGCVYLDCAMHGSYDPDDCELYAAVLAGKGGQS